MSTPRTKAMVRRLRGSWFSPWTASSVHTPWCHLEGYVGVARLLYRTIQFVMKFAIYFFISRWILTGCLCCVVLTFLLLSILQLAVTVVVQLTCMRNLEKFIGWGRIMFVYIMSGCVGNFLAAYFQPYRVNFSVIDYYRNYFEDFSQHCTPHAIFPRLSCQDPGGLNSGHR